MRDWSHQEKAVSLLRDAVAAGHRRVILVMPTGSGKSRVAGAIVAASLLKDANCQTLFLAHRRNLVEQMRNDTFRDKFGLDAGFIMSGHDYIAGLNVYCGTVQTVVRRLATGLLDGDMFQAALNPKIIFIDECHRGLSDQYQTVYDRFPNALIVGLTATPCLADGRGLGEFYDHIIDVVSADELEEKKILAPVMYYTPDASGLSSIKQIKNGDYVAKDQDKVFNTPRLVGDTVSEWLRLGDNRQTILFAVSVAHSINLQRRFAEAGIVALHLEARSTDEERAEAFRKMQSGEAKIVCNVGLYVEGADVPDIWCVHIAYKTKSLVKWWQSIGRGRRNPENPEHEELIVIDQGGNLKRLGVQGCPIQWTLAGKDLEHKKKAYVKKTFSVLIYCKSCDACFGGGKNECPRCGTELINYGEDVETSDFELVPYKSKTKKKTNGELDIVTKIHMMSALLWYRDYETQKKRKYKKGWEYHQYKGIFKEPPNDAVINCTAAKPEKGSFGQRQLKRIQIAAAYYRKKTKEENA